jgi:hypothetical protein
MMCSTPTAPPQPPPPPPPPPSPQSKGNFECEEAVFTGSGNTPLSPGGSKFAGTHNDASFHSSCVLFPLS